MLCTLALLLAFDAEPHDAEQPAFEQHTVDPHGEAITTNTAPRAVFILVGSLTDSLDSTSPGACTAGGDDVAAADPAAAAGCTLRAAMQLANRYGKATAVTIRVRSGRIAVAGPLPTLEGTVQMVGSPPRAQQPPAGDADGSDGGDGGDGDGDDGQAVEEVDADADPYYPHGESSGPTGPIGTVLDGGKRDGAGVQILRTGSGSAVALHTLRFENGRAMGSSDDGWGEHGGAIHARGTLVLTNCAIRNCEAFNGGGVYAEGDELEAHSTVFTRCTASRCGGCVYRAGGGRAHFNSCTLSYCHDRCGVQVGRESAEAGRYGALPGGQAPAMLAGGGGGPVGRPGRRGPGAAVDMSGAIAEGPRLRAGGDSSDEMRGMHERAGRRDLPAPGGAAGPRHSREQGEQLCVSWRQTGGCSPTGKREPENDRACHKVVMSGASGYCECVGTSERVSPSSCDRRPPIICASECVKVRR